MVIEFATDEKPKRTNKKLYSKEEMKAIQERKRKEFHDRIGR